MTSAGNLLHSAVADNSSSPYSEIFAQNVNSASAIPLYLQWGGGNIVFSSVGSRGASTSVGSTPLTGTQKFTFGGGGSAGNQLAWNINSSFTGDAVHIRGDADNYGTDSRGAFVVAANSGSDTMPGDRLRLNGKGWLTLYNGSGTPGTPTGGAVMWANSGVFNFKDSSGNTCAMPAGGTLLSTHKCKPHCWLYCDLIWPGNRIQWNGDAFRSKRKRSAHDQQWSFYSSSAIWCIHYRA